MLSRGTEGATGTPGVQFHAACTKRPESAPSAGRAAGSFADGKVNAKFHVRRPQGLLACHLRPPHLSPGVSLRPSIAFSQAADFCHHGPRERLRRILAARINAPLPRHLSARRTSAAGARSVCFRGNAHSKSTRGDRSTVSPPGRGRPPRLSSGVAGKCGVWSGGAPSARKSWKAALTGGT